MLSVRYSKSLMTLLPVAKKTFVERCFIQHDSHDYGGKKTRRTETRSDTQDDACGLLQPTHKIVDAKANNNSLNCRDRFV